MTRVDEAWWDRPMEARVRSEVDDSEATEVRLLRDPVMKMRLGSKEDVCVCV